MHENIWFVAAIWMGLAFIASLVSIRVGISVALIEILVGVIAGNIHFADGQTFYKQRIGSIFWRCSAAVCSRFWRGRKLIRSRSAPICAPA